MKKFARAKTRQLAALAVLAFAAALAALLAPGGGGGGFAARNSPFDSDGSDFGPDSGAAGFIVGDAILAGFLYPETSPEIFIGTVSAIRPDGGGPLFCGGRAAHPRDIVITNGVVGVALAAGTPDPWGYPAGSVVDAGRVFSAPDMLGPDSFGKSTLLAAQFLPNGWDVWTPWQAGTVHFDLVHFDFGLLREADAGSAGAIPAVRVARRHGGAQVFSYVGIEPGMDYARMASAVVGGGGLAPVVSLSNLGGTGIDTWAVQGLAAAATYNREPGADFLTALMLDGGEDFDGFGGWRAHRDFQFGQMDSGTGARLFGSLLLIGDSACWQRVYDIWAARRGLASFEVSGQVTCPDGLPVAFPAVLVFRGGALPENFRGWVMGDALGNFSARLPDEGDGALFYLMAEAAGRGPGAFGPGIGGGADGVALQSGGELVRTEFRFRDSDGSPIWGRISLSDGDRPYALFTRPAFFFGDAAGSVAAMLPPGPFRVVARGQGQGFYSAPAGHGSGAPFSVAVYGEAGAEVAPLVFDFRAGPGAGWFGIDPHHHGGRMDAFSPPEVASAAQAAAGLSVLTLQDHDTLLDNYAMYRHAERLGAGFMPGIEVSPLFEHFQVLPVTRAAFERLLDRRQENPAFGTGPSGLTMQSLLDSIWAAGAVPGRMHPYDWGQGDVFPGGYSQDYVAMSTGFRTDANNYAISLWNAHVSAGPQAGLVPKHIFAATDVHDSGMTSEGSRGSGGRRTYAYVEGGAGLPAALLGIETARALARGNSYNSSGVFLHPQGAMFGMTYLADEGGGFSADFGISSLGELSRVYVLAGRAGSVFSGHAWEIEGVEQPLHSRGLDGNEAVVSVRLDGVAGREWFSIAVFAEGGRMAVSNPVWVVPHDTRHIITGIEIETMETEGGESFAAARTVPDIMPLFCDGLEIGGRPAYVFRAPAGWLFGDFAHETEAGLVEVSQCRTRLAVFR